MKTTSAFRTLVVCLGLTTLTASALAQTVTDPVALRRGGEREFTIGAAGISSKDFDESFGTVDLSYGWYSGENQLWVLRQSISYTNPDAGGSEWQGSTRIAFDQHFGNYGALRPFVGVNFGGVYGDNVPDTLAAGLEGGVKFYVQPRTFVFAMAEYGWFFDDAEDVDERFDDGRFNWSIGLGFNF